MNWSQLEGNWKQFKGEIRARWGRLTDDDMDVILGNREKLLGRLQERYGIAREEAEAEVDEFMREERTVGRR